jgi:hypothetical protein
MLSIARNRASRLRRVLAITTALQDQEINHVEKDIPIQSPRFFEDGDFGQRRRDGAADYS